MKGHTSLVRMLLISLLCCLSVSATRAGGADRRYLFQWTDDQGGVHVTDDAQKIPQKYRSRTTQIGQPGAREGSMSGPAQQGSPTTGRDVGDGAVNEELKKAEWQQRMIDAKLKLQYAEDRYAQIDRQKSDLQAQWGASGAALPPQEVLDEVKRLDADLAGATVEVYKARDLVNNVIPDEARRAGIPPGWLREVE